MPRIEAPTSRTLNSVQNVIFECTKCQKCTAQNFRGCRGLRSAAALVQWLGRGATDAKQLSQLGLAVFPSGMQFEEVLFLLHRGLGLLPRSRPLALATFIPSRVRIRIRSASNSEIIANTLNSCLPIGSVGSWTEPPLLRLTSRLARSSAISWASRTERARRSSLVTTKVSPARHAAKASRSHARFLFLPVKP